MNLIILFAFKSEKIHFLKLPILQLHYGGTRQYSSINIQLDPLSCSGKKTFFPSELATAERSLLRSNVKKLKNELMEQIDFIAVSD